jgi:hypothetical protein
MTKLEVLFAEKAEKFAAICALVARELGYGELSTISEEDRNQVEDDAEQYVELCGERRLKCKPALPFARSRLYDVSWGSITTFAKESSMSVKSRSVSGSTGEGPRKGVGRRPSSSRRNSRQSIES